jgi:hypothetical protein
VINSPTTCDKQKKKNPAIVAGSNQSGRVSLGVDYAVSKVYASKPIPISDSSSGVYWRFACPIMADHADRINEGAFYLILIQLRKAMPTNAAVASKACNTARKLKSAKFFIGGLPLIDCHQFSGRRERGGGRYRVRQHDSRESLTPT